MMLISNLFKRRQPANYNEVTHLLVEGIDSGLTADCIYKKLYCYLFDGHLDAQECIELVSHLGEQIWTMEETNSVARRLGISTSCTSEEFWAAMHIQYYSIYQPLKDSNVSLDSLVYGRLADHYLKNNKLVTAYFDMI